MGSIDSESVSLSSNERSASVSNSTDSEAGTIEDSLDEEEVEPLLDTFTGFANDNVGMFYSPFFVLLLWVFYEETVVANMYGIKVYDFVYYFLFQVTIVPF